MCVVEVSPVSQQQTHLKTVLNRDILSVAIVHRADVTVKIPGTSQVIIVRLLTASGQCGGVGILAEEIVE